MTAEENHLNQDGLRDWIRGVDAHGLDEDGHLAKLGGSDGKKLYGVILPPHSHMTHAC